MRMNSIGKASLFTGMLLLASVASADSGAGTRGFVVTAFAPAIYEGDSSCPEGFNEAPDLKTLLAKAPPAKRERALRSEYRFVLACTAGEKWQTLPAFKTVAGKESYGLNLDDSDGTKSRTNVCAHDDFVSPGGEPGIDNQWYRVIGCLEDSRPGGVLHEYFNTSIRKGELAILIEISGIDDAKNDDEVRVGFYRAAGPVAGAEKIALDNPTLQSYYDHRYHSVARGRIVKGILTTEPVDVHFRELPHMREFMIRDARVRMELQPSGQLKGMLGGYQEFKMLFDAMALAADADIALGPLTCPYSNQKLKSFADGYPESQEHGPCSWISVAYAVEAAPATVIHPETKQRTQMKQNNKPKSWWSTPLWRQH